MLSATVLLSTILPALVYGQGWDASRHAWYTSDSNNDWHNALPIGNGRLGAFAYGSIAEKLTLNENSVWSGPWQDRVNPRAKGAIQGIWNDLVAGRITSAGNSAMSNLAGDPTSPKAYNPLVNLDIDLGHGALNSVSNYTRWLDTLEGTSGVSYVKNGVTYRREYVASYPHGVLAFRLTASEKGKLNANISLWREKWILSQTASLGSSNAAGHSLVLSANSGQSSNAINFWSDARIVNIGGTVKTNGKSVSVTGADTIDIFFNAETSYRYSDAAQAQNELRRKLSAAVTAGFDTIRDAAVKDFSALAGRVSLNLGSSGSAGNLPVPTRLVNYRKSPNADPQLLTLMYNFGRHSLIASSRDTGPRSLPANLQGLWNKDYNPAWQSKYTININLEMNYWPAMVTNLAETQKPVFDLINIAIPRGQDVAKRMYGCDQGFVLHHNIDLWGDAAPVDKGTPYTVWPMGAAWLSHDAMEHYRFTQNTTFLRTTAWPILQQTSQFLFCYLKLWNNYYTLGGPSLSPEHAFIVPNSGGMSQAGKQEGLDISIEMDNQLLRNVFSDIIDTCAVLKLSDAECSKSQSYLPKIRPPGISPSTGRIMEWRADYADSEKGHRHFSPLFSLFPGSRFTPLINNTLAAASKKLLDFRLSSGSGSTGWSRTWAINLYARLLEGDTAWRHLQEFIQKFPSDNLWNSDNGPGTSMQIDGNFGFVAGLTECLVQSHIEDAATKVVHLLPAMGKNVKKGSVSGLVARGNFVVEGLSWEDGGKFVEAKIRSRVGGSFAVRVGDGKGRFEVSGPGGVIVTGSGTTKGIETTAGQVFTVKAVA
ncbi:Six-hairpin glycosidase-like protein [Naviculisporaceae sp. PSN 640]